LASEGNALLVLFCHYDNPTAWVGQVATMVHLD